MAGRIYRRSCRRRALYCGLIGGNEGGLNQTLSKALKDAGTHEALENGLDGLRKGLGLPEVS